MEPKNGDWGWWTAYVDGGRQDPLRKFARAISGASSTLMTRRRSFALDAHRLPHVAFP